MVLHYRKSHLRKVYDEGEIREMSKRAGSPRTLTKSGTAWTALTSETPSPKSGPTAAAEVRSRWDSSRGGGGTRSGWGDLTSDAKEAETEEVKENFEKTARANRILNAHRQTLERVNKQAQARLTQLRDYHRPEDELLLAELENMRPHTAPAGEASQTTGGRSQRTKGGRGGGMFSPRKVDDAGGLCFIPKNIAQTTPLELYKQIPKSLAKRRPRRPRSERGPGLGSVSGWGALGLTSSFRHTYSEIAAMAQENRQLEEVVDALERERMRLTRNVEHEKEMIEATGEEPPLPEDGIAAHRTGSRERGPSPTTRSGWGDPHAPKLKR